MVFPTGKAGNVFRGAFGITLRRVCCKPDCVSASSCDIRARCPYARLFEPRGTDGPSGLADWPRPFVMRAAALDGTSFEPGQAFSLDMHVFDLELPVAALLAQTWARLAEEGIGPARGRFDLKEPLAAAPVEVNLSTAAPADHIRVQFLTPTELKGAGELRREPEFAILFARLRDRISTLRRLYQQGPLEIDFRAMAARAGQVRLTASELHWETSERFSTRTRQSHPLGGMAGWAEYAGDLGEFVPYLRAGYWTGVGRQTVWGKGVIRCDGMDGSPAQA